MASTVPLEVQPREWRGKGPSGRSRKDGGVPGVVYGLGDESAAVVVAERDLYRVLHTPAGMNVLITLSGNGGEQLVMPREVQRHPVRGDYIHVDLLRVDPDELIGVVVPIDIQGEEEIVFGVVNLILAQLPVKARPSDVPDSIQLDVSEMEIGDTIHAKQITLPAGTELDVDPERTVVTITAPTIEEEPEDEGIDLLAFEGLEGEELEAAIAAAEAAAEDEAEAGDEGADEATAGGTSHEGDG